MASGIAEHFAKYGKPIRGRHVVLGAPAEFCNIDWHVGDTAEIDGEFWCCVYVTSAGIAEFAAVGRH